MPPPTVTYNTTAEHCPPLQVASALIVVVDADPQVNSALIPGETDIGVQKFNENSARAEGTARYGGGSRCVATGLEVTDVDGLVATLAAGAVHADGYQDLVEQDVTVAPEVYSWVYVLDGVIGQVTRDEGDGTDDPPSLPAGSIFLHRFLTDATDITAIDDSGVFRLGEGGVLMRQTADAGQPADTPDAGCRHWTKTEAGVFLWDGSEYHMMRAALAISRSTIPEGDVFTIPVGWQALIYGDFTVLGELIVDGELLQLEAKF